MGILVSNMLPELFFVSIGRIGVGIGVALSLVVTGAVRLVGGGQSSFNRQFHP